MHNFEYFFLNEENNGENGGDGFNQATATPEEIAQRLSVSEGSFIEADKADKVDVTETAEEKAAREALEQSKKAPETFTASPVWDVLKADEGFTMPEGITAENEQELIKPLLAKKFGFDVQPELHPLAKQIQDMASTNPNLTINDLVNEVSEQFVDASKMSADEKISFDLFARYGVYDAEKNPDGLTEQDVTEYIAKLTKIEKQEAAKIIEQNINEYNKKLTDEYQEKNKELFEKEYETIVTKTKEHISKLKIELSKVDSIFGVPVNQEQHAKYLEEFERIVTPDKTTRERVLDNILSNDMLLYKVFVAMVKNGEDKVIEMMTKGRENAKEELFKKLEITPSFSSGNSREYVSGKEVDYVEAAKLLSQPQR